MKIIVLIILALLISCFHYKVLAKKPSAFDGIRLALWVDVWILMAIAGYILAKG